MRGCYDFERKLTKSGKEDLKKLFKNLASHEIHPDLVLSSPAVRTAKTAKKIAKFYNFDKNRICFDERLYLCNVENLLKILQDIDDDGVLSEGLEIGAPFDELWDRTVKSKDRPTYGWEANPWVWVIGFERISREVAMKND